jgi:phenylacetate-CoA ligase
MSKIMGRRDDMLVVRGVNVYPSEVERVVLAEDSVSPDYLLVLDEREPMRRLIACLEPRGPVSGAGAGGGSGAGAGGAGGAGAGAGAAGGLAARLRDELGLRVDVRLLPPGTVPRSEVGKAVRVVRWTEGEPPLPGLD